MNKLKRLLTSENENVLAFFNVLGPLLLNGINFLTLPIFTGLLSTANFGLVSLYTTWVQVTTVLVGLQTYGAIAPARVHIPEEEHKRFYSSILSLSLLSSAAVCAVVLLLISPISRFLEFPKVVVVLILLHSVGMYFVNFANMKYIHNKQAFLHFLLSLSVTLLSLGISLFLVLRVFSGEDRYLGRLIGYAAPNFVIGAVLAVLILFRGKTFYNKAFWSYALKISLPLILHNLSQIILSQSDRVMLQKFTDVTLVGIYSAIFTIAHIINIIYNALNNTWMPVYYDHLKAKEFDRVKQRSRNYVILFSGLSIGFILLSPEVTRLIVKKASYWEGIPLIPVMVLSFYFIYLYSFPVNFEFFHKKTGVIAVGTLMAAGVNIACNALMIPRYGMMGAAVATLISYAALFVFHYLIAKFAIGGEAFTFRLTLFIPGLISVIAASAIFYLLYDYWIVRWGIGAAVGVFLLIRLIRQKKIF